MKTKHRVAAILVFSLLVLAMVVPAAAGRHEAEYKVTITNLTEQGQWFTPPLAATHRGDLRLFRPEIKASFELKEIAENGNLQPMIDALSGNRHVHEIIVAAGDPPPLAPGASITFNIHAERGAKFLSFVSMLICTNDGFTGASRLRLPKKVGDDISTYTNAYDAGSEINTEDFADLVPPCPALSGVPSSDPGSGTSNPVLYEGGVVRIHAGIEGGVDLLPEIHGFESPVAMVTIIRTR